MERADAEDEFLRHERFIPQSTILYLSVPGGAATYSIVVLTTADGEMDESPPKFGGRSDTTTFTSGDPVIAAAVHRVAASSSKTKGSLFAW